jgi:uncharacterized protein (DUF1015 family)
VISNLSIELANQMIAELHERAAAANRVPTRRRTRKRVTRQRENRRWSVSREIAEEGRRA